MAKKIPTYGALKSICAQLEQKIAMINLNNIYLKKESTIQRKIIDQLKVLHVSTLKTTQWKITGKCAAGHYNCKIDHSKFNFVNQYANQTTVATPNLIKSESISIKRLSKQVDIIQAKYGMPCKLHNTVMVASEDAILLKTKTDQTGVTQSKKPHYCRVPLLMMVPRVRQAFP